MSEPEESTQREPEPKKRADEPGKADALALGIGCLVFIIFFIAIVLVGSMRE